MFADNGYSVDAVNRFRHGGVHPDSILLCLFASHVVERKLVDIEGHSSQTRRIPLAVESISVKQSAHEDVGVRIRRVHV